MAGDHTDIIKVIIKGIVQECGSKGELVSESLAVFMLRVLTLDSTLSLNLDESITEEVLRKLINKCSDRLLDTYSPSVATIKMQIYFELNYRKRDDFLKHHYHTLGMKLMPGLRTITATVARTARDYHNLYHQIVSYIMLRTGMGNPRDPAAFRETKTATESVFPFTEMPNFALLSKKEKRDHLEELSHIVSGIRLYNKEMRKGGAGIHNVIAILIEAAPIFSSKLKTEFERTKVRADELTSILDFHVLKKEENIRNSDQLIYMKELLANVYQYLIFLEKLMKDSLISCRRAHVLQQCLGARLEGLHVAVVSKSAIPTNEVFPLFANVAQVWTLIQEEVVLLSTHSTIARNLRTFAETAKILLDKENFKELLRLATESVQLSSKQTVKEPVREEENEKNLQKKIAETEVASVVVNVSSQTTLPTGGDSSTDKTDQEKAKRSEMDSKENLTTNVKNTTEKPTCSEDSKEKINSDTFSCKTSVPFAEESDEQPQFSEYISIINKQGFIIYPNVVKNFNKISLQYQGFCPWALVKGDGVLLVGKRELGIIMYEDLCYGYSYKSRGEQFLQDPKRYIQGVIDVARRHPELILLLQLQDFFHLPTWFPEDLRDFNQPPVFIVDAGTQTEIHPVKSYFDYSYRWNEWDLRRLALKAVDIQQMQTHSTQTNLSHFRRENYSQVYLKKENGCQTKRNTATNTVSEEKDYMNM